MANIEYLIELDEKQSKGLVCCSLQRGFCQLRERLGSNIQIYWDKLSK